MTPYARTPNAFIIRAAGKVLLPALLIGYTAPPARIYII